jgi:hypothetical protein
VQVNAQTNEGNVSRKGKTARTERDEVSCWFLLASRTLLCLFAVLLVATPWTEGYRLLDNFPTGQDSELNILALLAFLGLVLLITRSARRKLRSLLLRDWLCLRLHPAALFQRPSLHGHYSVLAAIPPLLGSCPSAFNLPLQI